MNTIINMIMSVLQDSTHASRSESKSVGSGNRLFGGPNLSTTTTTTTQRGWWIEAFVSNLAHLQPRKSLPGGGGGG